MKRINSLNYIRIFFMLWIVAFHAFLHYGFRTGNPWVDVVIQIGSIAVTGFFMISGFTLRYSYHSRLNDAASIKKFYKNRLIGIYPVYLFLLIVSYVVDYNMEESLLSSLELLPIQLTLMQTFFYPQLIRFSFNNNFWYVSVAFALYLIFPALNYLANKIKHPLVWVFGLTVMSEYQYWVNNFIPPGSDVYFFYYQTFFRIPEFFIGVLLCEIGMRRTRKVSGVTVLMTLGTFYGFLLFCYQVFYDMFNLYNCIMIPAMSVLLLACQKDESIWDKIAGTKPVSYLAGLGLTMYLCQSLSLMIVERDYFTVSRFYDKMPLPYVFILMTIGISIAVNLLIERPCKYLLKKLWVK